jgi:hypothetical protein
MTLSVRSSSLNDTTKLQRRLLIVIALTAMLVFAAVAVVVAPTVRTWFGQSAAVSNTGYSAAPGVSDPIGEHNALGLAALNRYLGSATGYHAAPAVSDAIGENGLGISNSGYIAAPGVSDPIGEHNAMALDALNRYLGASTGFHAAPAVSDPSGENGRAISNTGYWAAPGVSDPAGEHNGLDTTPFTRSVGNGRVR